MTIGTPLPLLGQRRGRGVSLVLAALPALVLSVVLARPLSAQEDNKVLAKTKLVEGGELLKRGEYTDALARFKEAFDLVPSPKIFYNFGLAYTGLGRNTEAIEAFEKFLDEASDAGADVRANAERQKSMLVPKVASIAIQCDTDGAEISVDGRSYGTTPRKYPLRVDPGPHSLIVEKAPAPPHVEKLTLEAGKRATVVVKLAPAKLAEAVPPPVIVAPVPVPEPPPPPPRDWKVTAGWVTAAAAAAAVVFGIYERSAASKEYGKFNDAMPANWLGKCDSDSRVTPAYGGGDCAQFLNAGDSAATKAIVGFVAGGALAAASATLFILSHRERQRSAPAVSFGCLPAGIGNGNVHGVVCDVRF